MHEDFITLSTCRSYNLARKNTIRSFFSRWSKRVLFMDNLSSFEGYLSKNSSINSWPKCWLSMSSMTALRCILESRILSRVPSFGFRKIWSYFTTLRFFTLERDCFNSETVGKNTGRLKEFNKSSAIRSCTSGQIIAVAILNTYIYGKGESCFVISSGTLVSRFKEKDEGTSVGVTECGSEIDSTKD